ncbi:MAG TPA: hypothetical protein VEI06_01775 [Gemmatimonadaceae bacterium]|nr:hypothetical protein [Gemmatimonadaceae bacterium]
MTDPAGAVYHAHLPVRHPPNRIFHYLPIMSLGLSLLPLLLSLVFALLLIGTGEITLGRVSG